MTDEDRLLSQFEPACHKWTRNIHLPGMDQDDLLQEARLAVLDGARSFRPDASRRLTSHVIQRIKYRMGRLFVDASRMMRDKEAIVLSLDAPIDEAEGTLFADVLPTPDDKQPVIDRIDGERLLGKCLKFCETEAERAVLSSFWDGHSLAEAGRRVGLSRERMRQIRDDLLPRIRKGVMASEGA
jgi:RNA polymerase sigma factor (sigma-70 family)